MWWVKYQINYLRAHKELKASPLKPNVSTLVRSEKSLSFDVWCFKVKASKLCGSTPKPLSLTSKKSAPWFFSLISMFVAPASKLFSTSSFIAVAMLNTTCPEHIWWMDFWSIGWTTGDDEAAAILLNIREGSDFSVWSPSLTFGPSALQALEPNRKSKMAGTTEEKPEPVGRSIFLDVSIFVILKHLFCRTFNVLEKGLFVLGFPESRQNRWVPSLPSDVTKSLTHKKFRQTTASLQANLDKYKISQVVSGPVQAPNFSWAEPNSN